MIEQALVSARGSAARWTLDAAPPLLVGFLPLVLLGSAQGGYFPSAWGWATLGLIWPAGLALVLRPSILVSRAECVFVLAWLALGTWIALSFVWSSDPPQTVLEVQRVLVYVTGVCAIIVLVQSDQVRRLLGGALAGISVVALFSLATRLFPGRLRVYDPIAVYRLAQPLGYWNALAIFTAIGAILALGFAARSHAPALRAVAAALLIFLLATFYFTFGRGGWIALGVGLIVMVALDPRRLQLLATLLVLAPTCVTAIWLANHSTGLTTAGASPALAAHDGNRLAIALVILAAISAAVNLAFCVAERRIVVKPRLRMAFASALTLVLAAGLIATFAHYGSPATLTRKAYTVFKGKPPQGVNLNKRLLSVAGNGRYDLWRVAWNDVRDHPWTGSGAGSYGRFLLSHPTPDNAFVLDAHGLYIETLAELGPLGLALLIATLGIPLVVAVRVRGHPIIPVAAGAYAAFLAHTIVDWDWEVPVVMLAGLLCGGAILLVGSRDRRKFQLGGSLRVAAIGAAIVVATFATVALIGNRALDASDAARKQGDWVRAAAQAQKARTWLPWSARAVDALGNAQLGAGLVARARTTFLKAVAIDPNDWQLWYDLSRASRGAQRTHALRRVAVLYPRSPVVRQLAKQAPGKQTP